MRKRNFNLQKVEEQNRRLLFELMEPLNKMFDLKGESIYLWWKDRYYSLERRLFSEMVEESVIEGVKNKFKQAERKHGKD